MIEKSKYSNNYTIYRNIKSKLRQSEMPRDISYLLVFTFLYKYCSDSLKDYFLSSIEDKEMTLDEAFKDGRIEMEFENDAFHMFGYYIKKPSAFIDEVINTTYQDKWFLPKLYTAFRDNVRFIKDSNYEKYFNFIFDCVESQCKLERIEFDPKINLVVKDIIYSISKLDIYEEKFPFSEVYDGICELDPILANQDVEYMNNLLAELVFASKSTPIDVYNPFLNDASSLIELSSKTNFGYGKSFAKGHDTITFCCSIVKLLISYFNMDNVFLEFENALDSTDFYGRSFDVVMSNLPSIGGWSSKSINTAQEFEILKRNRRRQIKNMLTENFNVDKASFTKDDKLNNAIDSILDEMVFNQPDNQFTGEYESLKTSEYLFLINLIDSLKDDGIMVVSIAQSFLFKNSLETLRKYLTDECNYLDCVISIPGEFGRYMRPQIICVFRKDRNSDEVLFIDVSKDYKLKKVPRSFRIANRKFALLDEASIKKLIEVYSKRQVVEKYSNIVSVSEIAANEFNLSVSRYVDTFEGEFIQLTDLANEKTEITSEIKKLNKKIDEMMEELNLRF